MNTFSESNDLKRQSVALCRLAQSLLAATFLAAAVAGRASAADMSVVPLFDGERADAFNTWGGQFTAGSGVAFTKQTSVVRSGNAAYRANLGSVPENQLRFFQTFSGFLSANPNGRQNRDLTQYDSLTGYVRNDTTEDITFSLELKDWRDSNDHRARRSYTVPADGAWTPIEFPLDLSSGWDVDGSPDLTRTYALGFLVDTDFGDAAGSLYLDDFTLKEKGPSIDAATAPIETVVERLAHRQFHGLWAARNRVTGFIPNSSETTVLAALNTTTGVVWNLPSAIRRGWVTQTDADAYMGLLVNSLHDNRDQTTYLPTRFVNLVNSHPMPDREESTIDAAFLALALHHYKSQPGTPAELRDAIDGVQNRFDFSEFIRPNAFNHNYIPGTGFAPFTYAGFTNENRVIALAAQVSDDVALAGEWNKETVRTLAHLVDQDQEFLVYSGTEFRAPFLQALLNIFVDTSDRGVDSYPNRSQARNPWINFVRYEDEVAAKLEELGREHFFQPDAGFGPDPNPPPDLVYNQWSLFNTFGQPPNTFNVFQPWSVAEALMAGAEGADDALRFLLDNGLGTGLDGPLGLADWALWPTGADDPTRVPSSTDNWNMALSTMSLLDFLDDDERASLFFANLPEVKAALDTVFLDGDLNGNGMTNGSDLAIWRAGFGKATRANPAGGDADGDGDVDGHDFLRWQRGFGGTTSLADAVATVPEPGALALLASLFVAAAARPRGVRAQSHFK